MCSQVIEEAQRALEETHSQALRDAISKLINIATQFKEMPAEEVPLHWAFCTYECVWMVTHLSHRVLIDVQRPGVREDLVCRTG